MTDIIQESRDSMDMVLTALTREITQELRRGDAAIRRLDGTLMGRLDPAIGLSFVPSQPEKRAEEFERAIDHAFQRFNKIIDDDPEIPLIRPWTLRTSTDEHLAEHLRELEIPTLHDMPCLLLHRLGKQMPYDLEDDKQRMQRINDIFAPETPGTHLTRNTVLLNTSGAGKTRLALEGLLAKWGFYFTCKTQVSDIGSADIEHIIEYPNGHLSALGLQENAESKGELEVNQACAARCFQAVLAARFLVFVIYLRAIVGRPNIVSQDAKRKWLFAQIDTRLLATDKQKDLFLHLTTLLCYVDTHVLVTQIQKCLAVCRSALCIVNPHDAQMHFVIDEAQTAAEKYCEAFRDGRGTANRPVLRPLIVQWATYKVQTVITGTSLEHKLVTDAISSSVGKTVMMNDGVTSTGSWMSDRNKIEAYLKSYLPRAYLETPSGKELQTRVCYWLPGRQVCFHTLYTTDANMKWVRPRFVAAFVQYVINHDFQSYHRLLTRYIKAITRHFVPRDGECWEDMEAELPKSQDYFAPRAFDFDRGDIFSYLTQVILSADTGLPVANRPDVKAPLLLAVQKLCCHRLMTGDFNFAANARIVNQNMVECGFARYGRDTDSDIIFDEPLAYLAAEAWIGRQGSTWEQRHGYFLNSLELYNSKENGLENYTALCLAHAFMQPTKLSSVFEFADIGSHRQLAERKARLVSCWVDSSRTVRSAPVIFPLQCIGDAGPESPSHILCKKSSRSNAEDDLDWLRCEIRAPFFFPLTRFGPDILFRLRLEDGTNELITIAVQVKSRATKVDVNKSLIQKAIRTVTPHTFWTNKVDNAFAPDLFPELKETTLDCLRDLPDRFCPNEPDYYSVLRVVFFFPAYPNEDTCEKVLKNADSEKDQVDTRHELAVLPSQYVKNLTERFEPPNALEEYEAGVKHRNLEIEFQHSAIRFENRKPYDIFNKFTRREQIQRYMILDNAVLEAATNKALGGQLDLHRRMEWAFNQATRRVPTSEFKYMTPTRYNKAMYTRTAKLEAVREAITRWTVMEAMWTQ